LNQNPLNKAHAENDTICATCQSILERNNGISIGLSLNSCDAKQIVLPHRDNAAAVVGLLLLPQRAVLLLRAKL
jgi:hypothetical protein